MKFGQLIECNVRIMHKMRQGDWFQTSIFFKKARYVNESQLLSDLRFHVFWCTEHTTKIKTDPETTSIFIF